MDQNLDDVVERILQLIPLFVVFMDLKAKAIKTWEDFLLSVESDYVRKREYLSRPC